MTDCFVSLSGMTAIRNCTGYVCKRAHGWWVIDLNDGSATAAAKTFALESQRIRRALFAQDGVLRAIAGCRVWTGLSMADLQRAESAVAESSASWVCERSDLRVAESD